MDIYSKLKAAREMLDLSQKRAAEDSGMLQKDLSRLENGKRVHIPNRYLSFLHQKGLDINSIFSDSELPIFLFFKGGKNVHLKRDLSVHLNDDFDPSLNESTEDYDSKKPKNYPIPVEESINDLNAAVQLRYKDSIIRQQAETIRVLKDNIELLNRLIDQK
jgi:transcriptional regulator with XRE-family HTH domain